MPDTRETTNNLATLAPSGGTQVWLSFLLRVANPPPPRSTTGVRDREYKLWGTQCTSNGRNPTSGKVFVAEDAEPTAGDDDQLFEKRLKQSFARGEVWGWVSTSPEGMRRYW